MAKKKTAKRRAAAKPAAQAGAFAVDQRIKVVAPGHWALGYLGAVRGVTDNGRVIVQLDVKHVTHEFDAAQLAAV